MEFTIPSDTVSELGELVKNLEGIDVNACYQCRKCTSGCPLVDAMDYTPTQIMHAVRLGLEDLVLNSSTIWLCLACGTCVTRCPQEVDVPRVMDALAITARRKGVKPKAPDIARFYNTGLAIIRYFGKMYDLGIAGMMKLTTRKFTQDTGLGIKMFRKGKLGLLPGFQNTSAVKKIFDRVKEREKA